MIPLKAGCGSAMYSHQMTQKEQGGPDPCAKHLGQETVFIVR